MKKLILFISCLLLLVNAQAVTAQDDGEINIYPIPAVFTSKDNSSPRFCSLMQTKRNELIKQFLTKFKETYPTAKDEISDKIKYKTFAAYINIPRVSEYVLDKGATINVYVPMTMSINFVNMATSETLYSYPATVYKPYETTPQLLSDKKYTNEKIDDLYLKTYDNLLSTVIKKSGEDFKPFSIKAKVIDNYKNVYILDKGMTSGIAKNDLLTDEHYNKVSVLYSSLDYSVVKPELGKPSIGNEFNKFANSNIMQLTKPKVLFINDINSEKLYNLFSSALGSNADFSLINVDKTFYDMQQALVSLNDSFKSNNAQKRKTPDYFLKLYLTEPLYTKYQSEREYLNLDKYSIIACGVIFDKSGRIVFSKCTDDEITEKVVSGIRFNDLARYEVLQKNALNKLAAAFQSEVKFKDTNLKITKVSGNNIYLADPNGFLKAGGTVSIFKKIHTETRGTEILIPTGEYNVIRINNGKAECNAPISIIGSINYPSKSDIAQINTITKAANKANMFSYTTQKPELEGNEVILKNIDKVAFAAIASGIKSPLEMDRNELAKQIKELNTGYGFETPLELPQEDTANLTIKPVYRIKLISEKQKGTMLQQTYNITVGIVSYDGEKVINKEGLMQEVTLNVPQSDNVEIIQYELLKTVYPLLVQLSAKF